MNMSLEYVTKHSVQFQSDSRALIGNFIGIKTQVNISIE